MLSSRFKPYTETEAEFIPWSDAPEHLKYDASRVYYDGKPVRWIAKPEGGMVDVVYVKDNRVMGFSSDRLNVKL